VVIRHGPAIRNEGVARRALACELLRAEFARFAAQWVVKYTARPLKKLHDAIKSAIDQLGLVARSSARVVRGQARTRRVLGVFDHSVNREVLVLQLKLLGIATNTAENGVDALTGMGAWQLRREDHAGTWNVSAPCRGIVNQHWRCAVSVIA
jgi:hypothetical protein